MLKKDWTKDSSGNYVRWHHSPHKVNGLLNLVLPGEDIVSHAELSKRRGEYLKLCQREVRRRRANR